MSKMKKRIICACILVVVLVVGVFCLSDDSDDKNDKKSGEEINETSGDLEDKMLDPEDSSNGNELPIDIIEDDENVENNSNQSTDNQSNKDENNSSETIIPDNGNELPVDHFTSR